MACILIVDRNVNLVEAVTQSLHAEGHIVIGLRRGAQAIRSLQEVIVHLMIVDAFTCSREGTEVCRALGTLALAKGVPIILLMHPGLGKEGEACLETLGAGVGTTLVKPFEIAALEKQVTTLLEGVPQGARQTLKIGSLVLDLHTFKASIHGRDVTLTPTEFALLRHLMEHAGEVVSSETLLHDVWKFPPNTGNPEVVRTHIRNLRAKIGPSEGQIIQTIPRHGYTISLQLEGGKKTTAI
ncbi:MAG: response regulator transcription factor [Chloroflexi bacterium]|nr:response regulator transcription factor [Chloroflexota bacterium]